jgi:Cu-Zn family superoxide dismutase
MTVHRSALITAATLAATTLAAMSLPVPAANAQVAKATLKSADGKTVGEANLVQGSHGVLIRLVVTGLPVGQHAVHVHAVGKCEPPFDSAGGHFNPDAKKHGIEATDGAHAGDMPNLHVPSNGDLAVEILNTDITLEKGRPNSVFDPDGSALVIHANADDYKSDPAGNAGGRIACGVITE